MNLYSKAESFGWFESDANELLEKERKKLFVQFSDSAICL